MGKFIVCDGMDRCGKDTLIKGLRKLMTNDKILVHHSSSPPKGVDQVEWSKSYYSNILGLSCKLCGKYDWDIIANRCHIGENVYGPIFRNTDSEFIWEIEEFSLGTFNPESWLILLVDNGESVIERDDGLCNEKTVEDFNTVRAGFIESFNRSGFKNKIFINISKDGWPDPQKIYETIFGTPEIN